MVLEVADEGIPWPQATTDARLTLTITEAIPLPDDLFQPLLEKRAAIDNTSMQSGTIDTGAAERRRRQVGRWSQATLDRYINFQLVMARLDGLTFDESAVVVGIQRQRLIGWIQQAESIPHGKAVRLQAFIEMLSDLRQLIEPSNLAEWFHLPIPALRDATPLQAIAGGKWNEVRKVARSYTDPSFS
jgi:hypothetical protein